MKFLSLHVRESGEPILINLEAITRIGVVDWDESGTKADTDGTIICMMDGGSVDVREDYATVKRMIEDAG